MDTGLKLAVAAVFVWLGMVLAISFLEAPLKFRAPGVTLEIGLGIGRLVFGALNVCEYVFAIVIAVALFPHESSRALDVALCVAIGTLFAQTLVVRPLLSRRTAMVLDGGDEGGRRSGAHFVYVALELVKVIGLVWAGALLVGGSS